MMSREPIYSPVHFTHVEVLRGEWRNPTSAGIVIAGWVMLILKVDDQNTMPMETETMKNELKNEVKRKASSFNPERKEGPIARAIESQTARIPSDAFLWTSIGTMAASLALKLMNRDHTALFVGMWAAPFLLLGIYNKIVKVEGHDQVEDHAKA